MEANGKIWALYNIKTKKQSQPMSVTQAQVEILKLKNKELKDYLIWTPGWEQWQNLTDFLKTNQKYFVFSQPSPFSQKNLNIPKIPDSIDTESTPENHSTNLTITETRTETGPEKTHSSVSESPYTEVQLEEHSKSQTDYGYYFNDFNGDDLSLSDIQISEKKIKNTPKVNDSKSRRSYQRLDLKLEVFLVSRTHTFKTYSQNISLGGTLLYDDVPKAFFNTSFDLLIVNKLDPNPSTGRLLFKAKIVGELLNSKRLRFIEIDKTMTEKLKALLNAYITYQKMTKSKAG